VLRMARLERLSLEFLNQEIVYSGLNFIQDLGIESGLRLLNVLIAEGTFSK
jgi:hypothetical protein